MYLELHVPDFDIAKNFYQKLGFQVVWEKRPEGELRKWYMVMKLCEAIFGFYPGNEEVWNQTYFKNFPKDTKRGYGVEIVIEIENIDELYDQAKQFANIVGELQLKHWGLKDFRIEDPFGYYIRFTEPIDILNIEKRGIKPLS